MTGKMLVSRYVSERDEKRKTARACNVATWFIENFSRDVGNLISAKAVRTAIRETVPNYVRNVVPNDKNKVAGDLKAHSDACFGTDEHPGLRLDYVEIGKKRHILFSLINLKRCTSWLLGKGRVVKALQLIRDPFTDGELINLLVEVKASKLTAWEGTFVNSLNANWRDKKLSERQRSRALKILAERS